MELTYNPISWIVVPMQYLWLVMPWWYHHIAIAVFIGFMLHTAYCAYDEYKLGYLKEAYHDIHHAVSLALSILMALALQVIGSVLWAVSLPAMFYIRDRMHRDFLKEFNQLIRDS
ncbi:MAG TPA: hypothetical protein VK978_00855 [Candidatus Saccharimonadales bacterium]|nr:hypothetical protein [Candidatus Saccharimonadales bacterium]